MFVNDYRLSVINYQLISWRADAAPYQATRPMSKRPHNLDVSHAGCIDVISMCIDVNTCWHGTYGTDVGATLSYLLGLSIQVQVLKFGKLEIPYKLLDWHSGCCVMVKLNLKNRTFHIWYSMTVDKTLTHILTSSLLSSALSHFSEEKWGIYFVYLCNSRFAQCYLYNWAKFGTIYSQTGDCGEPWNLANCAAECQNLLWKTVGPSDYCSDVFWRGWKQLTLYM